MTKPGSSRAATNYEQFVKDLDVEDHLTKRAIESIINVSHNLTLTWWPRSELRLTLASIHRTANNSPQTQPWIAWAW